MPPHDFEADDRNAARAKFDYLRQERAKMLQEDAQEKEEKVRNQNSLYHDLNTACNDSSDAWTTLAMLHPIFFFVCTAIYIICWIEFAAYLSHYAPNQPLSTPIVSIIPFSLLGLIGLYSMWHFVNGLIWRSRIKKRKDAVADRG